MHEVGDGDTSGDRVSVISVGSASSAWSLPVKAGHQEFVGGSASGLNARLLGRLCDAATDHQFRRRLMTKTIERWPVGRASWSQPKRRPVTDQEVIAELLSYRKEEPSLTPNAALRILRDERQMRCGRERLQRLWDATLFEHQPELV